MPKLANLPNTASLDRIVDEYGRLESGEKSAYRKGLEWTVRNECIPQIEAEKLANTKITTRELEAYIGEHLLDFKPAEQQNIFNKPKPVQAIKQEPPKESEYDAIKRLKKEDILQKISRAMNADDLRQIMKDNPRLHCETWFKDAGKERQQELIDTGFIMPPEHINYIDKDSSIPF